MVAFISVQRFTLKHVKAEGADSFYVYWQLHVLNAHRKHTLQCHQDSIRFHNYRERVFITHVLHLEDPRHVSLYSNLFCYKLPYIALNPAENRAHITLKYAIATVFHIVSNSLFIITVSSDTMQNYSDDTALLNKVRGKCEVDVKNKWKAADRNQMCKLYVNVSIIFVALWRISAFSTGSALRCYYCDADDCSDPYTGKPEHERNCVLGQTHCAKADLNDGKWLHNWHCNMC